MSETDERETRGSDAIEIRLAPPEIEGPGTLVGYATVWDSPSENMGGFVERFRPGAFSHSLRKNDVIACDDHQEGRCVGRMSAGTLKLSEDEKGLRFENELPNTTVGRDLAVSVARGDIRAMSFAFVPRVQEWDLKQEPAQRSIKEADIHHIAYVTRPAYGATSVALRSLAEARAAALEAVRAPDPAEAAPSIAVPSAAGPVGPGPDPLGAALARLAAADAF